MVDTEQQLEAHMSRVQEEWDRLKEAVRALGHIPEETSTSTIDSCTCSCGWESPPFFDGKEYAREMWTQHALAVIDGVSDDKLPLNS
jgi:hypothetical protein